MSEIWSLNSQSTKLGSSDQKMAFSCLHNTNDHGVHLKDPDSLFAANVKGLSSISLMSHKASVDGNNPVEYSLFNTDGLPPPVLNSSAESKPISRSSSAETFWGGSENRNGSLQSSFNFGFDLLDPVSMKMGQSTKSSSGKVENDKIAAAIWGSLPESAPKNQVSKAVGAEMQHFQQHALKSDSHLLYQTGKVPILKPTPAQQQPVFRQLNATNLPQNMIALPPNWSNLQGQLASLLPPGSQNDNYRIPNAAVQQRAAALTQVGAVSRMPEISNIISAHRPSSQVQSFVPPQAMPAPTGNQAAYHLSGTISQANLTAPLLHSAIGQINELTVHALNQTAAMIMDRHQLESKLLHYAPEQFRSVYNELALPEPLESMPGKKETSGVDMLLTAQLRENLRINTLVRRIKVVSQLTPSSGGQLALEKWTEDVRNFQAFLMKMHERARRLRLSSTIAATLYSGGDSTARVNDAASLANTLSSLMSTTLNARQALFQLGERALMLLSQSSMTKKTANHAISQSSNAQEPTASRSNTNFQGQAIPVNPESANQLWRQLVLLPSQSFAQHQTDH